MLCMNTTVLNITELLKTHGLLSNVSKLFGREDQIITGADSDSRVVEPYHLFICKGAAFRSAYLVSALEKGAVAYLCDESHAAELALVASQTVDNMANRKPRHIPALVVPDAKLRHAMALASAEAWGYPNRKLKLVGITGTKGKSTAAYMLRYILDTASNGITQLGSVASVLGSIASYDGVVDEESTNTTPESPDLWRHLHNASITHHSPMVMEVSSQALKYQRVEGLRFDIGCFLNIGRDHISPREHPNFEDYFASKLRMFAQTNTAVVNLETDHLTEVLNAAANSEKLLCFAVAKRDDEAPQTAGHTADVWADHITTSEGTVDFVAHTPTWTATMHLAMPGLFNVENALCAIAVSQLLDIDHKQIRAGLAHCRVPGRMELLSSPDPQQVAAIVDYAHNKLSYQRFFASVKKEFPGRRLIAVFGAPGDKAHERRRELPREASKWADVLIYTEEDPAHERVEDINAEMLAATPQGTHAESIPNRFEAIKRAVKLAYAEHTPALVCLLAKGDETRQHVGDKFVPTEPDEKLFLRAMKNYATQLSHS